MDITLIYQKREIMKNEKECYERIYIISNIYHHFL